MDDVFKPFLSNFEDESDSSDEDSDEVPHEESDQEGIDELSPDEFDPDQEALEEVDTDKLNSQKFDIDAVVTLAATFLTSKTSSLEAQILRSRRADNQGGPDTLLHERTVAVLDALAHVSVSERSPTVAIGLTMKPLQLVVSTKDEISSATLLEHLDSIYSTLRNISNAKFCTCLDPNSQLHADLREESPPPDSPNENLDSHYNDLFLQIYKYSHDRLQPKMRKRWDVLDRFAKQLAGWRNKVSQGNSSDQDEPHKTFFVALNNFYRSGSSLGYWLDQFSRSGWKMDAVMMDNLKFHWENMLTLARNVLDQEVEGRSLCDHWAWTLFMANQQPDKQKKPIQLQRAIEKLVSFNRHVFTLIRFANSKRMHLSFLSSKITVIPAEKTRPSVLSWPLNKQEWRDLLRSIYGKHRLTSISGMDVEKAKQSVESKAAKCGVAATIHAECAIVAYLHKYAAFQAFSYIGVSRLCCKACHYWMEAFNHTMGTTFRTRGSHDKWYKGWARPGLEKSANQGNVDAVFLALVEEELCKHQIGKRMARLSGDSDSLGSNEYMVPKNVDKSKEKDEWSLEMFPDVF